MILSVGVGAARLLGYDSHSIGWYNFGVGSITPSMLGKHASSLQLHTMGSTLPCFVMCLIRLIISCYGDTNNSTTVVGVAIATYPTKTLLELVRNRIGTTY